MVMARCDVPSPRVNGALAPTQCVRLLRAIISGSRKTRVRARKVGFMGVFAECFRKKIPRRSGQFGLLGFLHREKHLRPPRGTYIVHSNSSENSWRLAPVPLPHRTIDQAETTVGVRPIRQDHDNRVNIGSRSAREGQVAVREARTEILFVGAGVGGVAGAIAALKLGRQVILTEETDSIGGQLSSQAMPPDEHPRNVTPVPGTAGEVPITGFAAS